MKIRQARRAISPVLATVILIAITLIAAIAVAGFVFGLFESFTRSADIEIVSAGIDQTGSPCSISFTNSGTIQGIVTSVSVLFDGVTYNLGIPAGGFIVPATGSTYGMTCSATLAGVAGQAYQLAASFTGGQVSATAYYTGTFS